MGAMRRIQVVAHRGASERAPEHTLAAYERAIEDGADALECDIRLTRDGVPVCVHDVRVNRTSNGRGRVTSLELAALRELDFGSWHSSWDTGEEPDYDDSRRRVLTLERLLELATACPRPVELAIETKHPTRYAGAVERAVIDQLERFGLARPRFREEARARLMSFSLLGLRRAQALAPTLPTVWLLQWLPLRGRDGALPPGVTIAGPSIRVLRRHPEYPALVHARGHEVHVWTVDAAADVELAIATGADALITNRPAAVRRRLATLAEPVARLG